MAATNKDSTMSTGEINQTTLENVVTPPEVQLSTEEIPQAESEALSAGESSKVADPISISVAVDVGAEKVPVGDVVDVVMKVPGGDKSVDVSKDVGVVETGGSASAVVMDCAAGKSTLPMEEEIPAVSDSAGGLLVDQLDVLENVVSKLDSMNADKGGESQAKDSESTKDDVEIIEEDESPEPSSRKSKKRKASKVDKREQPPRSGKKQRSSLRKKKEVKVPEPLVAASIEKPKTVMDEFSIDEEFLVTNQLEEVFDLIKFQEWEHLFKDDEKVDKELVAEFYKKVSKVEKGTIVYLNFVFQGQELTVSSRDLAFELGLKNEGFDTFTKGSWPESVTEEMKEDMELRICNYYDPNVTDLTTLNMEPKMKILHRYLLQTILPRGSKPALAQIQDILVLDQIMRKQKVNLPKLIIHQMEYVSNLQHVGHARFVKKILQFQNVYNPSSEVSVMKQLTMHSIHRWGILLDPELGWIRKKQTSVKVPEVEDTKEGRIEDSMEVDQRLSKIEGSVAEIKKMLADSKTDVGKMCTSQWLIEEEINEIKKIIEAGFAGLKKTQ